MPAVENGTPLPALDRALLVDAPALRVGAGGGLYPPGGRDRGGARPRPVVAEAVAVPRLALVPEGSRTRHGVPFIIPAQVTSPVSAPVIPRPVP
jgi:hypothetical protein